jgi:DNA-binding CsgD family transcriptional regulator
MGAMTDRNLIELSERELEILRLVATGASNKEIAQQLTISANTVKVHLRNIFNKIGVASRTEAAMYCVRQGLVESIQPIPVEIADIEPEVQTDDQAQVLLDAGRTLLVTEPTFTDQSRRRVMLAAVAMLGLALTVLLVVFYSNSASQATVPTQSNLPVDIPPTNIRWMTLAGLTEPRHSLAVAAVDNFIFAIGGENESGVSGLVERYSIEADRWEAAQPKPVAVSEAGAAVIGGLIFVPGGRTASGEPTELFEVYDPRQDHWEKRASMPKALSAYALTVFEGRLYLFGGWDGQQYVERVYEYDPTSDSWQEMSPMPTRRGYAGAAVVERKVYVLGGYNGSQPLSVNEVYSPDMDRQGEQPWETELSMPESRYGMAVTSIADIIQIVGGIGETDGPNTWFEYVPSLESWGSVEPPIREDWSHLGIVPLATRVYLVGGRSEGVPVGLHMSHQVIYTVSIPIVR